MKNRGVETGGEGWDWTFGSPLGFDVAVLFYGSDEIAEQVGCEVDQGSAEMTRRRATTPPFVRSGMRRLMKKSVSSCGRWGISTDSFEE